MKHFASPEFWACLAKLPGNVQELAREKYELLKGNPYHPSLHFKRVGRFWSVRVGRSYRALAVDAADGVAGSGSERTQTTIVWSANRGVSAVAEHAAAAR